MKAACWHNSYWRIFCSWQIQNCFVSEISKTNRCFEIMCFGYWGVCWGGGNCSVPCHGKRCPREAQKCSDPEVVLQFPAVCDTLLLHPFWEGAWRWCKLGFPSSIVDLGLPGDVVFTCTNQRAPFEILGAFRQDSGDQYCHTELKPQWHLYRWMAIKTYCGILILHRLEHVLTLGTCIISISASLVVRGLFIKYFSIYLNFPVHFWACAFLGSQFLF